MHQGGPGKDFRYIAHEARSRLFISLSYHVDTAMDRHPLLAMGRHYPGKALRIRSRPNWQIAIAWDCFSFERTRLSQSAVGCGDDRGETIAEACKAKRTLPLLNSKPFRGEIRSKA